MRNKFFRDVPLLQAAIAFLCFGLLAILLFVEAAKGQAYDTNQPGARPLTITITNKILSFWVTNKSGAAWLGKYTNYPAASTNGMTVYTNVTAEVTFVLTVNDMNWRQYYPFNWIVGGNLIPDNDVALLVTTNINYSGPWFSNTTWAAGLVSNTTVTPMDVSTQTVSWMVTNGPAAASNLDLTQ